MYMHGIEESARTLVVLDVDGYKERRTTFLEGIIYTTRTKYYWYLVCTYLLAKKVGIKYLYWYQVCTYVDTIIPIMKYIAGWRS